MYITVIFKGYDDETLCVSGYPFVANTVYAFSKASLLPVSPEKLKDLDSRILVGSSKQLPDDAVIDWMAPAKPVAVVAEQPQMVAPTHKSRG